MVGLILLSLPCRSKFADLHEMYCLIYIKWATKIFRHLPQERKSVFLIKCSWVILMYPPVNRANIILPLLVCPLTGIFCWNNLLHCGSLLDSWLSIVDPTQPSRYDLLNCDVWISGSCDSPTDRVDAFFSFQVMS